MSGLFLIMPTVGEYRVVEAAVQGCRLPVQLWMSGIGPGRAAALCAKFEHGAPPGGVALLGWAGALRDDLTAGDIVLADRAILAGGSDVDCAALPLSGLTRLHCGPVMTASRVLATPEAKRSAAQCGALAVEMEAYPLAAWAAKRGMPFVHGRVILDAVNDALPELDGAFDAYGRVQVWNLVGALVGRPDLLREFVRFPSRLRGVNRRLAELAAAVVKAWPDQATRRAE